MAVAASAESFDNCQPSSTNYGPGANDPPILRRNGITLLYRIAKALPCRDEPGAAVLHLARNRQQWRVDAEGHGQTQAEAENKHAGKQACYGDVRGEQVGAGPRVGPRERGIRGERSYAPGGRPRDGWRHPGPQDQGGPRGHRGAVEEAEAPQPLILYRPLKNFGNNSEEAQKSSYYYYDGENYYGEDYTVDVNQDIITNAFNYRIIDIVDEDIVTENQAHYLFHMGHRNMSFKDHWPQFVENAPFQFLRHLMFTE